MNTNAGLSGKSVLLTIVIAISMVLAGCGGAPAKQAAAVATAAPSATPAPSNTPQPTSTETPLPTATATETVVPTATQNLTATAEAQQTATQAAINELVGADLAKYGIDSSKGHVAWVMEEPVELDGSGYGSGYYQNIEELGSLKDFVVQSKVTWKTSGALAGCGYIFRAPEDWNLKTGDFYELSTLRIQYDPIWYLGYYEDGWYKYALPNNNGAHSKNLIDENDTENMMTLDARGDKFTIYINGVKERTLENNKLDEGALAFEVIQNSGTSYCKFDEGWVWVYDE